MSSESQEETTCWIIANICMQGTAALFSAISAMALTGTISGDIETRGAISLSFTSLMFTSLLVKATIGCHWIHAAAKGNAESDQDYKSMIKIKAVILGMVDCAFDIIAAVAFINGFDLAFEDIDKSTLLLAIGTWSGVSEEVLSFILELLYYIFGKLEIAAYFCVFIELSFGAIEFIVGFMLLSGAENIDQGFKEAAIWGLIAVGIIEFGLMHLYFP
eukprot:442654_1